MENLPDSHVFGTLLEKTKSEIVNMKLREFKLFVCINKLLPETELHLIKARELKENEVS